MNNTKMNFDWLHHESKTTDPIPDMNDSYTPIIIEHTVPLSEKYDISLEAVEEAAKEYSRNCNYGLDSLESDTAIDAFIAGAKWHDEQIKNDQWATFTIAEFDAEIEKAEERGYNLCKKQMENQQKENIK